jgi:protein TonB
MESKNHLPVIIHYLLLIAFLLFIVRSLSFAKSEIPYPGDEDYLAFAEEMPSPIGGMPAIIKLISYPTVAKNANIEGKVYVLAYINEKGSVDDVKVLKGIGGGCDEAAIDAVKKSKFIPGKNSGVSVKVKLSLTITFKIN